MIFLWIYMDLYFFDVLLIFMDFSGFVLDVQWIFNGFVQGCSMDFTINRQDQHMGRMWVLKNVGFQWLLTNKNEGQ